MLNQQVRATPTRHSAFEPHRLIDNLLSPALPMDDVHDRLLIQPIWQVIGRDACIRIKIKIRCRPARVFCLKSDTSAPPPPLPSIDQPWLFEFSFAVDAAWTRFLFCLFSFLVAARSVLVCAAGWRWKGTNHRGFSFCFFGVDNNVKGILGVGMESNLHSLMGTGEWKYKTSS